MKKSFRTENGFTLIEVIVALTIMSLVLTVAFSGLSIGIDSWERGTRRVDQFEQRMTVERLFKRQLAVALPLQFQAGAESFVLFRGSNQRLEFISDYSLPDGPSDFRKIDYAVSEGRFLYGEKRLFDYIPADNEPEPTEFLAKFSKASFQFLNQATDGELIWIDDWEQEMGLPQAVRIQIDDDLFVIPLANRL